VATKFSDIVTKTDSLASTRKRLQYYANIFNVLIGNVALPYIFDKEMALFYVLIWHKNSKIFIIFWQNSPQKRFLTILREFAEAATRFFGCSTGFHRNTSRVIELQHQGSKQRVIQQKLMIQFVSVANLDISLP